jgi:hypothetical protein
VPPLEAAFCLQLKQWTQLDRGFLQQFSAGIDHLGHRAHVDLPEHLISARAFADGIRGRDVMQQLLLGHRKTLSEALSQVLELKVADTAVGAPSRVCQMNVAAFWGSKSALSHEETT